MQELNLPTRLPYPVEELVPTIMEGISSMLSVTPIYLLYATYKIGNMLLLKTSNERRQKNKYVSLEVSYRPHRIDIVRINNIYETFKNY